MLSLMITRFRGDPQRVTDILGIEPTAVVREGTSRAAAGLRSSMGGGLRQTLVAFATVQTTRMH
jgi:hypothetical protein